MIVLIFQQVEIIRFVTTQINTVVETFFLFAVVYYKLGIGSRWIGICLIPIIRGIGIGRYASGVGGNPDGLRTFGICQFCSCQMVKVDKLSNGARIDIAPFISFLCLRDQAVMRRYLAEFDFFQGVTFIGHFLSKSPV